MGPTRLHTMGVPRSPWVLLISTLYGSYSLHSTVTLGASSQTDYYFTNTELVVCSTVTCLFLLLFVVGGNCCNGIQFFMCIQIHTPRRDLHSNLNPKEFIGCSIPYTVSPCRWFSFKVSSRLDARDGQVTTVTDRQRRR